MEILTRGSYVVLSHYLFVCALQLTIQKWSSPILMHLTHCALEQPINFWESRSNLNRDIGQRSKIQHCKIGHLPNCYISNVMGQL